MIAPTTCTSSGNKSTIYCPFDSFDRHCCYNCTFTCDVVKVIKTRTKRSECSDYPEDAPDAPFEELFIEPINPEMIRLRRKQSYKKLHYKPVHFLKPYFKRKAMISISGWVAKIGYKRKKGYNKKIRGTK